MELAFGRQLLSWIWDFREAKAGSGKLVSWFYLFLGISEALWDFGEPKASSGLLVLWLYFFVYRCVLLITLRPHWSKLNSRHKWGPKWGLKAPEGVRVHKNIKGITTSLHQSEINSHFGHFTHFFNSWVFWTGSCSFGMQALRLYAHTKLFSRTLLFICSCQRSSRASNSSISSYFFTSSSITNPNPNSSPSASPSSFYSHFRTQVPILYRLTKRQSADSQRSSDAPFFHHREKKETRITDRARRVGGVAMVQVSYRKRIW